MSKIKSIVWLVFFLGWIDGSLQDGDRFQCHWFCPEVLGGGIIVKNKQQLIEWCIEQCSNGPNRSLPVILSWTNFFGDPFMNKSTLNGSLSNCPYQCIYTDNRRFELYASAIVFHIPDLNPLSLPKRRQDVLNVFFIEESPAWRWKWWIFSYKFLPKSYFNLTMTYRKDSDIFAPYGAFYPIENQIEKDDIWSQSDVHSAMLKKSSPILFLVSNCNTLSKRELYVQELAKYINITQFGKCANEFCDANCEDEQIKKHYFYLAFENSVCNDYITEKFWRLKKLIVPIVLDRKLVENTIPADVFIAASDFKDPSKLADYLQYLIKNPNEYAKYFNWTKKFQKSYKEPPRENRLCKLCEMAHRNVHKEIPNIEKWWVHGSDCYDDYTEYLLEES